MLKALMAAVVLLAFGSSSNSDAVKTEHHVGVVYSRQTGRIRWVLFPEHDWEISGMRLQQGEGLAVFKHVKGRAVSEIQRDLSFKIGMIPANDRYAVVSQRGVIAGEIYADPLCGDRIAGYSLVRKNY